MPGQVDGDERTVDRHRDRSHVCAFRAAVEEHVLGSPCPTQRADLAPSGSSTNSRRRSAGRRRQAELLRVLVEQPNSSYSTRSIAYPFTRRRRTASTMVPDDASFGRPYASAHASSRLDFRPRCRSRCPAWWSGTATPTPWSTPSDGAASGKPRALTAAWPSACSRRASARDAGRDHVSLGVEWTLAWLAITRIGAMAMLLSSTYRPPELRSALRIGDVRRRSRRARCSGSTSKRTSRRPCPASPTSGPGPLYLPALPDLRDLGRGPHRSRSVTPVAVNAVDGTGLTDELPRRSRPRSAPPDPGVVVDTSGSAAGRRRSCTRTAPSCASRQPARGRFPRVVPRSTCAVRDAVLLGRRRADACGRADSGSAIVCQERFDAEGRVDLIERERVTTMLGLGDDDHRDQPGSCGRRCATSARSAACRCRRDAAARSACRRGATRQTWG